MKESWLWIAGIIVGVWMLSDEKTGKVSTSSTYSPPPQNYHQPQPTYQQPSMPSYSSNTFGGYSCTNDCSGHEAGYNWAEENGIDDPDDCRGNSDSFIEGCQSYAEEQKASEEDATDSE
jgi:hypothetical protein